MFNYNRNIKNFLNMNFAVTNKLLKENIYSLLFEDKYKYYQIISEHKYNTLTMKQLALNQCK